MLLLWFIIEFTGSQVIRTFDREITNQNLDKQLERYHRNRRTRMRGLLFRFCLERNAHGEQRW